MWFYLFGMNDSYPDPIHEIHKLAEIAVGGGAAYLKLSPRHDAPMKRAAEGERVYLCTRRDGGWLIHAEAQIRDDAIRAATPAAMDSIYGESSRLHWWRRLDQIALFDRPKSESDLGLAEGTLPKRGQAHVIHHRGMSNGSTLRREPVSPMERLTEVMDAAWDEGRLSPEAIELAVREHRRGHPYGR
jgi:hypothetical protein